MVVVHRIWWWRLCSTTHLWTRRWLHSLSPEAQCLEQWEPWKSVVITAEAPLRCLSLAAVSFWHRVSSKLAAALWTEPCYLVCPWHIPPGLSDWCGTTGDWLWPCLYTAVLVYLGFFAGLEFPVHQASQHPTLLHSNHVSNPPKLGLDDGGLYAGGLSLIEVLQIGDVVLPPDSQDGAESSHAEELQFLDMPTIVSTSHNHRGKNHGIVELQFRR